MTPLMTAADNNRINIIPLLLSRGADINKANSKVSILLCSQLTDADYGLWLYREGRLCSMLLLTIIKK